MSKNTREHPDRRPAITPIETSYSGCKFRSRLEARWGVLFTHLGVEWRYEPEGFELGEAGRYLPDFYLPEQNLYVEIKGAPASPEAWVKIRAFEESHPIIVLEGDIPEPDKDHRCHGGDGWARKIPGTLPFYLRGDKTAPEDWGDDLGCPVCGYEYVHLGEVIPTGDWQGRGNAIRIKAWCECSHSWTIRFGFHKGNTLVAIEDPCEQSWDFSLWLADWDQAKCNAARTAARSARFEFDR